MQERGNWDHPTCWFPFFCLLISHDPFLGALAVIPASSAESLLTLAVWLLPQSRAASPGPLWLQGAPLRPGPRHTPCGAPAEGLSGLGCPPETLICVPVRHLQLGLCRGWTCLQNVQLGPAFKRAKESCCGLLETGALPKLSLLCRLLTVTLPISMELIIYFKILFSFRSTEGEGATGKLFQFHYSYG